MKINLDPKNKDDRLRLVGVALGYIVAVAMLALAGAGAVMAVKLLIRAIMA